MFHNMNVSVLGLCFVILLFVGAGVVWSSNPGQQAVESPAPPAPVPALFEAPAEFTTKPFSFRGYGPSIIGCRIPAGIGRFQAAFHPWEATGKFKVTLIGSRDGRKVLFREAGEYNGDSLVKAGVKPIGEEGGDIDVFSGDCFLQIEADGQYALIGSAGHKFANKSGRSYYESCEAAQQNEEPRRVGTAGDGVGYHWWRVPSALDDDGDGLVCEI